MKFTLYYSLGEVNGWSSPTIPPSRVTKNPRHHLLLRDTHQTCQQSSSAHTRFLTQHQYTTKTCYIFKNSQIRYKNKVKHVKIIKIAKTVKPCTLNFFLPPHKNSTFKTFSLLSWLITVSIKILLLNPVLSYIYKFNIFKGNTIFYSHLLISNNIIISHNI